MPTEVKCPKCNKTFPCPERLEPYLDSLNLVCGSCCGFGIIPDSPTRDESKIYLDWEKGSYKKQRAQEKKFRRIEKLMEEVK